MKTVQNPKPGDVIDWRDVETALQTVFSSVMVYVSADKIVYRLNVEGHMMFQNRTFSWRSSRSTDIHSLTTGWDAFVEKNKAGNMGTFLLFDTPSEFTNWVRKNPDVTL